MVKPKLLKSLCSTPFDIRYFPAGPSFGMDPAGEIWSVVIESPKRASTFAPLISTGSSTFKEKSLKKGGF